MKKHLAAWPALTLAAALILSGCASTSQAPVDSAPSAGSIASSSDDGSTPNSADEMFAAMMAVHHEQAIEMSDLLLAKDNLDPKVAQLAQEIKDAQGPEIQKLRGWQEAWGTTGHSMGSMGHGDGMMSADDLTKLKAADGPEASTLFLEQMIAHHTGAVAMAQDEVTDGSYGPAIQMAKDIIAVQNEEIDTMHQLLDK